VVLRDRRHWQSAVVAAAVPVPNWQVLAGYRALPGDGAETREIRIRRWIERKMPR
jgi:hypothetical protein